MREVLLGRGKGGYVACLDDADYDLVAPYLWSKHETPHGNGKVYARRRWMEHGRQRQQYMHNLIMGHTGIDHADGNGLNNQRYNLRDASIAENLWNSEKCFRAGVTSMFKGVSLYRNGRWHAQISFDHRVIHLGYFTNEVDAALAYDTAAQYYFGEFARLNFTEVLPNVASDTLRV